MKFKDSSKFLFYFLFKKILKKLWWFLKEIILSIQFSKLNMCREDDWKDIKSATIIDTVTQIETIGNLQILSRFNNQFSPVSSQILSAA